MSKNMNNMNVNLAKECRELKLKNYALEKEFEFMTNKLI